jgi:hypothetical protein
MSNLSIDGTIIQILKTQNGVSNSGKEWQKREFVIETEGQYPNKICFTLFGDKLKMIEEYSPGDKVEVKFNIESREYNRSWYHNINAWSISRKQQIVQTEFSTFSPKTEEKPIKQQIMERNQQQYEDNPEYDLPF